MPKGGKKDKEKPSAEHHLVQPTLQQQCTTNIGRRFRSLISKHFPKNSQLHKIFNRNTLKLSYSCMPNLATIIKRHNNKVLRDGKQSSEAPADAVRCNCREKNSCPLDGACQTRSIVYKASLKTDDDVQKAVLPSARICPYFYGNSKCFPQYGNAVVKSAKLKKSKTNPLQLQQ